MEEVWWPTQIKVHTAVNGKTTREMAKECSNLSARQDIHDFENVPDYIVDMKDLGRTINIMAMEYAYLQMVRDWMESGKEAQEKVGSRTIFQTSAILRGCLKEIG